MPSSWPQWSGISFAYANGRMTAACTGSPVGTCTSPQTALVYSYDPMGRVANLWQCAPYNVAWSPDGKRLAVLYDGRFDKDRNYVGELPQSKWPTSLPDIEAFDPAAGSVLMQCTSGHPESQIEFSPDGSVIYAISQQSAAGPIRGDGVRTFSSTSGKLVRVIAPNRLRLHNEFAVSPDGRFIAADASSELWHPFWTEPVAFSNVTRVVVLDSRTGRILLSRKRQTGVAFPLNPVFTPDGRLLIVQYGPYLSAKGKQRQMVHIVAYSLAGL